MIMKKNTSIARFAIFSFHSNVFSAYDGTGGEHGISSSS